MIKTILLSDKEKCQWTYLSMADILRGCSYVVSGGITLDKL